MGDRSGPGQHRGDDDDTGDHAPRHLPSTPPPTRYDLGYGAHAPGGQNGTAVRVPPVPAPPTTAPAPPAPPAPVSAAPGTSAADLDTGQMPAVPGPAVSPGPGEPPTTRQGPAFGPAEPGVPPGFGAGLHRPELDRRVPAHAHDWPDPAGDAHTTEPGYGHDHGVAYESGYGGTGGGDDHDRGVAGSVRGIAAEAAWRYRSAPMRVRIIADLAAASLVLLLIVGIALALRQDGGPEQATVSTRPPPSTSSSTTTTLPPTTSSTTTTAPTTTTTTTAPTTTTTAAPVVPPPTEAPTTTVPPTTTTTEPVYYRSCRSARSAGALPLRAGQPGYGEHLDSDRDGEACDDFDDWSGGGGGPG